MRFGFIGAGNMASAIIRGMTIGTRSYDGKDIFITSKSGTSAQRLAETCGATAVTTAAEVVAASDVLVLAVKPHILAAVLPALKEEIAAKKPLVVSIAAGKELAYLAELLPEGTPVVRIMPNINAKIGAATSGLCANALVTAEQKAVVKEMFATIGAVIEVEESQFGIFTVLAGSAPAFAYLYMDALARAAVKADLLQTGNGRPLAPDQAAAQKLYQERLPLYTATAEAIADNNGTLEEGLSAVLQSYEALLK